MKIYVVKQGDSVDSIAESQGIPVETLVWANQIEYPYRLAVGHALYISDGETDVYKRQVAEGADADFVVYDDSMDILHVMAGGRKAVWDKDCLLYTSRCV